MVLQIAKIISKNIRKIRKEKGFTLKQLSIRSKVSISMISKIENSQTLPSIATYVKIALALGVSFGRLTSDDNEDVDISIVKSAERPIITKGPYVASPLAYKKGEKEMEPFIIYYSEGKKFPKHCHENEEMIFVIDGTLKFKYGKQIIILEKGDCVYFNGAIVHGACAAKQSGAEAIVITAST
jgi:transcriptional regulator with XRE-family HTH domain